jgi:hypothetical protein
MTDTNSEKRAKMLEKVRLCIALANDPGAEPGEAEAARARADHLMTAYSIAQWEADVAPDRPGERPKPEIRWVNIDWWYDERDRDSAWAMHQMFQRVYRHCRCVVAFRGQYTEGHGSREMPVIGLASDLDWADQLFTSLMLQIANNLRPQVNLALDPKENVYQMRLAGMGWEEISERMWNAGLAPVPRGKQGELSRRWVGESDPRANDGPYEVRRMAAGMSWEEVSENWQSVRNILANWNRAWVKAHGLPRNYVRPDVYQRSFVEGFSREIRMRLFKMSEEFRRTYDSEHGDGSMALVVQDIATQALVLYNQTWPEPPPIEPDPNAKPVKTRMITIREKARSDEASRAGAAEAKKANLSNSTGQRVGSGRGALPEG